MSRRSRRRDAGPSAPTPFPWDKGPRNELIIEGNFAVVRAQAVQAGVAGVRPTEQTVRDWHKASVNGVVLAQPEVAGGFRGEGPETKELATSWAFVGATVGELPERVPTRVTEMFADLDTRLEALDARLDNGETQADVYDEVIKLCAWLHGEWVRIHPFADHNGSTARLLVLNVGLLYGVPLPLPGKPRTAMPAAGLVLDYGNAALPQMLGSDQAMVAFLHKLATA